VKISPLEATILKGLDRGRNLMEIAASAKTQPLVVGEKIARLQLEGFINPDGTLTQKGAQAVQD